MLVGINEAFQVIWHSTLSCHGDEPDKHYVDESEQEYSHHLEDLRIP